MGQHPARESLTTSREVLAFIMEHARGCLPNECCGLLLGRDCTVEKAWPARNEAASPTRYRVDPRDYVAAAGYGRQHGLDVVGAYHSHPSAEALPSSTDLLESAGDTFLYVIAGPFEEARVPSVRAFRFADGNFRELPVVTDTEEQTT